jgi:hypothetical protein
MIGSELLPPKIVTQYYIGTAARGTVVFLVYRSTNNCVNPEHLEVVARDERAVGDIRALIRGLLKGVPERLHRAVCDQPFKRTVLIPERCVIGITRNIGDEV